MAEDLIGVAKFVNAYFTRCTPQAAHLQDQASDQHDVRGRDVLWYDSDSGSDSDDAGGYVL